MIYHSHFYNFSSKPWFSRLFLLREQIVLLSRIRSNYYNLNYSLHRKNIVRLVRTKILVRMSTMSSSTALLLDLILDTYYSTCDGAAPLNLFSFLDFPLNFAVFFFAFFNFGIISSPLYPPPLLQVSHLPAFLTVLFVLPCYTCPLICHLLGAYPHLFEFSLAALLLAHT